MSTIKFRKLLCDITVLADKSWVVTYYFNVVVLGMKVCLPSMSLLLYVMNLWRIILLLILKASLLIRLKGKDPLLISLEGSILNFFRDQAEFRRSCLELLILKSFRDESWSFFIHWRKWGITYMLCSLFWLEYTALTII